MILLISLIYLPHSQEFPRGNTNVFTLLNFPRTCTQFDPLAMCDVIGSIDEDTMLYFTYNPFFGINDVDDNDYMQFTVVMSNGTVWLNASDFVNVTANTNFSTQGKEF